MAYKLTEINDINNSKSAVYRKIYIDVNGFKWIGKPDNTLKKIDNKDTFGTDDDVSWLMRKVNDLELSLQKAQDTGYTNFTYDNNSNIIKKEIFTNSTLKYKLFETTYTYDNDGNLTIIDVIRISDKEGYKKQFSYDNQGNLHNINIT